jgi:hypothetical protein
MMALADAHCRFIFVDVGYFGRQGDGGVFAHSSLGRALSATKNDDNPLDIPICGTLPGSQETFPFVFIGDAAFPVGPHLLKPFAGASLSQEQDIYNFRLSRARRCVESAFGIMRQRWRIFSKPIALDPNTATAIVKAGVVLHNYLKQDEEDGEEFRGAQCSNTMMQVSGLERLRTDTSVGGYLRERLMNWFSNGAGAARAPWQYQTVHRGDW